jgi:heme/copper-type cytochrome/quinol oxidase subunit 4
MGKAAWIRIFGIGVFHMFLYMYLVPFVIYPRYGSNGLVFTVITAVIISIAVLGTLWIGKKKNS